MVIVSVSTSTTKHAPNIHGQKKKWHHCIPNTDQYIFLTVVSREEARKGTVPARGCPEAVSTSSEFTHRAIVHLIEAMHRCWDVYGSHERSRLFQNVQSELENLGHSLPVEKIRRKWNNLIVTYKRVKERSRLGRGQAKTSWEYFEVC